MLNLLSSAFGLLKKRQTIPVDMSPEAELARLLRSLEKCGASGASINIDEARRMLDMGAPNETRQELARANAVSEEAFSTIVRQHLAAGGTIFACLGLADFCLVE